MPAYTSPEAGDIEAPDPHTAARWLMHRLAHSRYGDGAIVRQFQAWPLDLAGEQWTASAWTGAPRPGDGELDYTGIYVYALDALLLQSSYDQSQSARELLRDTERSFN